MAQEVERAKPVEIFHGHNLNIANASATVLGPSADLVASEVTIKAMVTNGFEIRAGQQVTVTAGSPSDLYVRAATGTADDVSWIAT